MAFDPKSSLTHRSVFAVAVPIMLSNVSEPMIGVVNTAVIGQLDDPHYIGAIAVGALIFSLIFWGFGFSGFPRVGFRFRRWERATKRNSRQSFSVLCRSPLWQGSEGWFEGESRAKLAFVMQLFLNLTNMMLLAFSVLHAGMMSEGVGLAALIADWAALLLALGLASAMLRSKVAVFSWPHILDATQMRRALLMNGDVMIRTLLSCLRTHLIHRTRSEVRRSRGGGECCADQPF